MMIKIREGLNLQQSPNHPGLVSRFLHGNQALNLTEGHHPLNPVLWASILEDSKLSGVLGADAGFSESMRNLKLIHSDLSASVPSTLSIFFTLETKGMGGGVLAHRRRKSSGGFGKLTHGHFLD
jgi:hypothetical protein